MKMFSLLLALCIAIGLTACGKDEPVEAPKAAVQPAEKMAPVVTEAVDQAKQVAAQVTENVEQVAQQVEEKAQAVVDKVKDTLASGQVVYTKACLSCHKMGLMGAPKVGDKTTWSGLIAGGTEKLVKNAINGIGNMPAKGGVASLTDEDVSAAVDYMVEQSR